MTGGREGPRSHRRDQRPRRTDDSAVWGTPLWASIGPPSATARSAPGSPAVRLPPSLALLSVAQLTNRGTLAQHEDGSIKRRAVFERLAVFGELR